MTIGCLVGQDVPDDHQYLPSYSYRCNGLSSDAWGIFGCESDQVSQTVNGILTHYELDQAAGLTQVLSDGTDTYLYGVGRIAQYDASSAQYFLGDALGSVRQLVDADGDVLLAQSYQPYGEALASAGSGATIYGFTGEWTDSYFKLVNLRSRIYSPSTGRFLTKDSCQGNYTKPLSLNGWNYVEGNPINFVDPSGMSPIPGGIDDLPVVLLDPRNLGYYAGVNVDLLPYLFYLNPNDFNFTASINYSTNNALEEMAISMLANKFASIVGQGDIPNQIGKDENYPTKFFIDMLNGKTFWRRLIEVHGGTKNLFSAWFVANSMNGHPMVTETFPLNSPDYLDYAKASVDLKPITINNQRQIVLSSEYMHLSFGSTLWLSYHYGCLKVSVPIKSFDVSTPLIETGGYFEVRFSTKQIDLRKVETKGEVRLMGGSYPAGVLTLRGEYTGPDWKLHVLDPEMAIYRK